MLYFFAFLGGVFFLFGRGAAQVLFLCAAMFVLGTAIFYNLPAKPVPQIASNAKPFVPVMDGNPFHEYETAGEN